jgi:hypothetical protein
MLGDSALAESGDYAAGNMWGTTPGGVAVNGAAVSAFTHVSNGAVAGAVNAARSGFLIGSGSGGLSIYSIGSQSIVSNTIVGDDNSTSISASQSASNTGAVSNQGTLNKY